MHEPTSNRMLLTGFVVLAVAILAVIGLGTLMFLRIQDQAARIQSQAASQAQIQRVILHSCVRGNTTRASDNNAHFGDFVVFSFVAKRFLTPTHTETAAQKEIAREFTGALHAAVADSTWTPLTDCKRAVSEQGVSYQSPVPVKFTTRLPPASALPPR